MKKLLYPIYYIRVLYYKMRFWVANLFRVGDKRVYIYTDSRGYDVNSKWSKKNPYRSYVMDIQDKYRVAAEICKYKHTTIIDFLHDARSLDLKKIDFLIMHLGVVDFSPRPYRSAVALSRLKSDKVAALWGVEAQSEFEIAKYDAEFMGEKTASLYTVDFMKRYILPEISELARNVPVYWLGVNKVLKNWNGNYFGSRPENMDVILEYQNCIDGGEDAYGYKSLRILNGDEEIKKLTVDNIHFSAEGMQRISEILIEEIGC